MQMSDSNMLDMSADMSDMRMDAAMSPPENGSVNTEDLQVARNSQTNSEAIIQPDEQCSHCMMHSRSGANAPLRVVLNLSNNADQVIAADSAMGIVKSLPSALTFLDLHDHGPPGSSAPLYILVSAFRI